MAKEEEIYVSRAPSESLVKMRSYILCSGVFALLELTVLEYELVKIRRYRSKTWVTKWK